MNRRLALALVALVTGLIAGCAQLSHVATGEVTLRDRMVVKVDKAWNQFERGLGDNTLTWTQDGISVDALRFYVGIKDGELIAPTPPEPKGQRPLAFKKQMQTSDVVALFEGLYSRGGSTFTLDRLAPETFVGQPGFRFEFSSIRKTDDVRLRGIGWGALRNGELFPITYTAPRLAFYPQHLASATAIAASARLRQ